MAKKRSGSSNVESNDNPSIVNAMANMDYLTDILITGVDEEESIIELSTVDISFSKTRSMLLFNIQYFGPNSYNEEIQVLNVGTFRKIYEELAKNKVLKDLYDKEKVKFVISYTKSGTFQVDYKEFINAMYTAAAVK